MGRVRLGIVLAVVAWLAACAGAPTAPPTPPDDSMLDAGETMLAKAEEAGAPEMAPQAWREARRRLSAGRSLLYRAAAENRSLTAAEKRRVKRLGQEAYVDARLALALTQQTAVQRKLGELRDEARPETDSGNKDSP